MHKVIFIPDDFFFKCIIRATSFDLHWNRTPLSQSENNKKFSQFTLQISLNSDNK